MGNRFPFLLGNRIPDLVIVALAITTYWSAIWNEFVDWDDPTYVIRNPYVAAGLSWPGIVYAFTSVDFLNWVPVTWLSYEFDASLFGLSPVAFHADNVFWHVLNSWLILHVLRQMTGSTVRSAVVAALFAVHPLHVESVAWVSERKDLLSTCGLLVTLLAYLRYTRQPTNFRYALVFCTMALGLMAKPMLVTLPLLLLLADYWPLQRMAISGRGKTPNNPWSLFIEKIPLLTLAIGDGLVTIAAQWTAAPAGSLTPFPLRIAHSLVAYNWYLWKTFLPTQLYAYYRYPVEGHTTSEILLAGGVLAAISIWVAIRRTQDKHLVFGWCWFLVSLLPVIGLFQVGMQAYADRYAYIPHIGLLTMVVWEIEKRVAGSTIGRWCVVTATIVCIAGSAALTGIQVMVWRNTESLWTQAIEFDPYNPIASFQLGEVCLRRGDSHRALEHYSDVFVYFPVSPEAVLNLGLIHEHRGELDLAARYFLWLFRLEPNHSIANQKLKALSSLLPQKPPEPNSVVTDRMNQGIAMYRAGNFRAAARLFQEAADLDPTDTLAQTKAAIMLEKEHRLDQARAYYQRALQADQMEVEAVHGIDRIDKLQAIDRSSTTLPSKS